MVGGGFCLEEDRYAAHGHEDIGLRVSPEKNCGIIVSYKVVRG